MKEWSRFIEQNDLYAKVAYRSIKWEQNLEKKKKLESFIQVL
jgi:hypothetical protein